MNVSEEVKISIKKSSRKSLKQQFRFWGIISAITFVIILLLYSLLVDAPPPKVLKFTSGDETGLYYQFAENYAEYCSSRGVTIEVAPSAGSLENLDRLLDKNSGFKAGLVQGGVVARHPDREKINEELRSIGSLYREPLWLFYRDDAFPGGFSQLNQLAGKKISAGMKGSGTFPVVASILSEVGINISNQDKSDSKIKLTQLKGAASAEALINGDIDAAFFVVGLSRYVRQLLLSEGISVFSFDNWEVFTRKYSYLSHITLPQGMVDIQKNLPSKTINLLAPVATLVVRKNLHSALQVLLAMAINQVHREGDSVFSLPDEFPSHLFVDIPLSKAADRYYRNGPPTLQKLVGFQWALWIDRIKLMIIPLIMLMMPLIKMLPPILRWRIRSRIYKWYAVIREADISLKQGCAKETLLNYVEKLTAIEKEVSDVVVPLSYMNEFYNMRFHLSFIQEKLKIAISDME